MTNKKDIVKYWVQKEGEELFNIITTDVSPYKYCWRCACKANLQRCHIIPDSLGGEDTPSNFLLLCSLCHNQAPNTLNPQAMFEYVYSIQPIFYNTFWVMSATKEFTKKYGREFLSLLNECNYELLKKDLFQKAILDASTKTSHHSFDSLNIATWVQYLVYIEDFLCSSLGCPQSKDSTTNLNLLQHIYTEFPIVIPTS